MDPEALQQLVQQLQGAQAAGGATPGDPSAMLAQMQEYAGFVMLISLGLMALFIGRGIYKSVKMHQLKKRIHALEIEVAELRVKVNAPSYHPAQQAEAQPPYAEPRVAPAAPTQTKMQPEEKSW